MRRPFLSACLGVALALTVVPAAADDEVVLIGRMPLRGDGAALWVDRGWWRIATAPFGYFPEPFAERRDATGRELFVATGGGGSGGAVGLTAVRLLGPRATVTLRGGITPLGVWPVSDLSVRLLDDEHVLAQGINLPRRPLGWDAHWGMPRTYQWLWERRDGTFQLVAERQDADPYYVLSAFVGGLLEKDPALLADVATPEAARDGLAIGGLGRARPGLPAIDGAIVAAERASWDALPDPFRVPRPRGRIETAIPIWDDHPYTIGWLDVTLERADGDWIVTAVRARDQRSRGDIRIEE